MKSVNTPMKPPTLLLREQLRLNWTKLLLALICSGLNIFFILLNPPIFQHIVDTILGVSTSRHIHGVLFKLLFWMAISVGSVLLATISRGWQEYFIKVTATDITSKLFLDCISHLLCAPYHSIEASNPTGTLGKLHFARGSLEGIIAFSIRNVFTAFVGFVVVAVYVSTISRPLMLALLLCMPVTALFNSHFGRRIGILQKTIHNSSAALHGILVEAFQNIELIKVLGLASHEVARAHKAGQLALKNELNRDTYLRSVRLRQTMSSVIVHDSIFCMLMLLIYRHHITMGQYITLYIYSFYIFGPLQEFGTTIINFRQARVDLLLFSQIYELPTETPHAFLLPLPPISHIAFEGVGFRHPSTHCEILRDVSFHMVAGTTVAIVGPSGSGKSTIARLVVKLYANTSGTITYNEMTSDAVQPDSFRQQVSFVTQTSYLFTGTIRENLMLASASDTDVDCWAALAQAQLHFTVSGFSFGLDAQIGEGGIALSGGERQRLAIARALLRKPKILILDEATSALDAQTERSVAENIRTAAQTGNMSVLVIAHRLSTIKHADHILVMDSGEIIERGTHDVLLNKQGVYCAMWNLQKTAHSLTSDQLNSSFHMPDE